MTTAITKFLQDFQDMYVDKVIKIDNENTNLTSIELNQMEKYIKRIANELTDLNSLTKDASIEAKTHYLKLLSILEDKIEFISDSADVYNYVNSYFDMRTVKDVQNYDLREVKSSSCIFDHNKKGITLKSIHSLNNCSKTVAGNVVTFYNTNNSYHTGLHIVSPYLDMLEIAQILIRKVDGTILELSIQQVKDNEYYINHENLQSSQISFTFVNGIQEYLETVELNLVDYTYDCEGYIPLGSADLHSSDLFMIISDQEMRNGTYANINLGVELKDVNGNILDILNTTIALNNTLVCKRLDRVNFNEVGEIDSLIIKNKKTKSNLSIDYLDSLEYKNEKYILYTPKELEENVLNKYLKKLGQSSFKINTKNVKSITFSPTLELFTFDSKTSPLIKYITGVTKNETI